MLADEGHDARPALTPAIRYLPLWRGGGEGTAHRMPGRFIDLEEDARLHGPGGSLCFQLDVELARYLEAKRTVLADPARQPRRDDRHAVALERARQWMGETLELEHPARFAGASSWSLDAMVANVQEDVVVMVAARDEGCRADPAEAVAAYVHVCLPSGWSPESILGHGFQAIHAPVPSQRGLGFEDEPSLPGAPSPRRKLAASMLGAATGPQAPRVRFVWTLSSDAQLDRHPRLGARNDWANGDDVFLRVERQVIVPLATPRLELCVFLIRVYAYAVRDLAAGERVDLAAAVRSMPEALARYKGLAEHRERIARLIEPR